MDDYNYFKFCYSPVYNFSHTEVIPTPFAIWHQNDFDPCFEYLLFSAVFGSVFGVVSAYYAGIEHTKGQRKRKRKSLVLVLRLLISLLIIITYLVDFIGSFWLSKERPYSVLFSLLVLIVAWTIHIFFLWVLSRSVSHFGLGPLNVNAAWLVLFVGTIFQLHTTIRWRLHQQSSLQAYFTTFSEITVYISFGLQCVYGLTLFCKVSPVTGDNVRMFPAQPSRNGNLQWSDDTESSARQHLISSEYKADQVPATYGSLTASYSTGRAQEVNIGRLEASEDSANPLSLLFFWWVGPLMRRGMFGLLQKPEDLPQLPNALKTSKLRERFQRVRGIVVCSPAAKEPSSGVGGAAVANISGEQESLLSSGEEEEEEEESRSEESDGSGTWHRSLSLNIRGGTPTARDQIKAQRQQERRGSSSQSKMDRSSLFWSLNKAFGLHYYPLGVLKLTSDMLGFAGPLLLHALVHFMENRTEPMSHGYYYALGLFLSTLLGAFLSTHFTYQVNKVGLKVRAALITEIYRKSLSVASCTLSTFTTGQIVNFMSTDSDRIVNYCASFHQFWSLPFQVVVSLFLLYQQVGLAFLGGLAFCVLLIPVNRWLAVKIGKLSTEMMAQKDKRVKVMSEILSGIRVIKLYAWEHNFITRILSYRAAELKSLKGRKYLDALCVYFWATTPVLISIITFTTYVAMGNTLTAAKIFTSLALFNILISPLNAFPWVINGMMEAWVSTKRVNAFLQLQELNLLEYYSHAGGLPHPASQAPPDTTAASAGTGSQLSCHFSPTTSMLVEGTPHAVFIEGGSFSWSKEDKSETPDPENPPLTGHSGVGGSGNDGGATPGNLTGINIAIKPGQFVGLVGKVGSGKSSLLMAISAEMRKVHGQVNVVDLSEGFGLFTQETWIQHATLRDNILFGEPYSAHKYRAVISATALEQDIEILPAGDKTEVGENGVTLSGGQKARLALARALYQDKSVYLLDDPLAAVDAHVASHIYKHCISGLLRHKTRILATHHTRFLRDADVVVFLEEGRVQSCGAPADVLPLVEVRASSVASGQGPGERCSSPAGQSPEGGAAGDSESGSIVNSVQHAPEVVLVKEEEKAVGVVSFSVYREYWSAIGLFLAPLILLSLSLMQGSRNASDWWLSYWITHGNDSAPSNNSVFSTESLLSFNSNNTSNSSSENLRFYLGIYGGLAASNTVFTLFRAFLYAYGGICAAMVIHRKLLNSILMAPTSFFDTTPIGRIINRFSSDIYAIDDSLPFILNILLAQLFGLLGTLVVTCYGLPWFAFLLFPLALFYYSIQKFYRRTSRELKRLSTVTLSPIYAHFSETLVGLCTIRALRASTRFMRENEERLEVNQRANFGSYVVAVWLGIRLQMLGVAMVTGVAFIAVLEHHFHSVNPGLVGLAISYALSVTNLLSGMVTSFTETEKEMVSVERAMQYINETPAERRQGQTEPPPSWPSKGVLEFRNVVLTYREGLPSALKEVCFITTPGEKIGVVGRTGAGKSSLFKALFRMVELSVGSILIDGVDIAEVPLERLRSSLAIIPQDPFLFSGSLRENLDPCSKHSDAEIWRVLEQCHLKDAVKHLGGLDGEVEEKGRVFSVGQRQLVCLARALLTRACLICIDEATASVDYQTDTMIQKTIREEFTYSTVITIAHRIDTVLGSDRILVMEQGLIREFASPQELLGNYDSFFYSLYKQHRSSSLDVAT